MNKFFMFIISVSLGYVTNAQVGIGATDVDSSAIFELKSTNKGFLPPRLNAIERNNIENPSEGLIIYNITNNCLQFYNGADWFDHCCAKKASNTFSFSSSYFIFDPVNESSFVKMDTTNGTSAGTIPVNDDFIFQIKDDVNNKTLDYEAGSDDLLSATGHKMFKYVNTTHPLSYKSSRYISRAVESIGSGVSTVSNLRYIVSPVLQVPSETYFIARIDSSSFDIQAGAIFNSHKQGENGHFTFTINSGTLSDPVCKPSYYTLSYSTPSYTAKICNTGDARVKTNDNRFHLFHIKCADNTDDGGATKVLTFSVDGVYMGSDSTLTDYLKFNAFKLFTSQTAQLAVKSDVSFFSVTPVLTENESNNLMEYLSCKYLD